MQALWSRVAQAPICGCRACTRASRYFAGGTVTARAPRQRAQFAHLFTAFYTTILGTAAVFDAKRKDDHRRELDLQIEEAKSRLSDLVAAAPRESFDHDDTAYQTSQRNRALGDDLSSICIHPNRLQHYVVVAKSRERFVSSTFGDLSPTLARALRSTTHIQAIDYEAINKDLLEEELDILVQPREPLNDAHLAAARRETVILAETLMDTVSRQAECKLPAPTIDEIREARKEHYPQFGFAALNPTEAHETRTSLNQTIRAIVEKAQTLGPHETVARIAYNMVVSQYPPGIQNYNTLLFWFNRLGWNNMAHVVVESLRKTRLLRSTHTMVCMLHHYRQRNDIVGFYTVIAELVAAIPAGARIRQREWEVLLRRSRWRYWAAHSDVAAHIHHVTERVPRTARIFETILDGLLHFGQVRHAIDVLANVLQQGCRICLLRVERIFEVCISTVDSSAAVSLVQVITDFLESAEEAGILRMKTFSANMHALLQLCGISPDSTNLSRQAEFYEIDPEQFKTLSISIFSNQISRKLARIEAESQRFGLAMDAKLGNVNFGNVDLTGPATRFMRRLGSCAGEEEGVSPEFAGYGRLLDEMHLASQVTMHMMKEFQWIVRTLLRTYVGREYADMVGLQPNPVGLLYSTDLVECLEVIRESIEDDERSEKITDDFEMIPEQPEQLVQWHQLDQPVWGTDPQEVAAQPSVALPQGALSSKDSENSQMAEKLFRLDVWLSELRPLTREAESSSL